MKQVITHFIWFIVLLAFQVLFLDNIHFLDVFFPIIYIYAILRLPSNISSPIILIISFLTGLVVDIFSNTPGMHTAATTFMGFLRYPVLRLFVLKEDLVSRNVSSSWLGSNIFWKYCIILVLIHHTSLFLLESFTFLNIQELLVKIPVCSLFTLLFIMIMEFVNGNKDARKS
jgi:rod shape-determining protein MreD